MSSTIGIKLNLRRLAPSQYQGFDFNSLCRIQNNFIAVNETGLFLIGKDGYTQQTLDTDNGTHIDAQITLAKTDFGTEHQKRMRCLFAGYQASGPMELTTQADGGEVHAFALDPLDPDATQGNRVPLRRDQKGRFWTFALRNLKGAYFEIKHLSVLMIALSRNRFS